MAGRIHAWLSPFFSLSKSEQRGIIVLLIMIVIILIFNLILPYIIPSNDLSEFEKNKTEINNFITQQEQLKDSIEKQRISNSYNNISTELKPFKFNPNNLSIELWKKIGLADYQISNIKNYEAKGGSFKKKEDLKKIYTISEHEYEILEPFITIPTNRNKHSVKTDFKTVELNSADSLDLRNSLGLQPWIVKRTLAYRNLLGGYYNVDQIKNVYGITDSIIQLIEPFIIIDTSKINKMDINTVKFKKLLSHPIFDYDATKAILNTRDRLGGFSNYSEFKLIDGLPDSTIRMLKIYTSISHQNNN